MLLKCRRGNFKIARNTKEKYTQPATQAASGLRAFFLFVEFLDVLAAASSAGTTISDHKSDYFSQRFTDLQVQEL